MLGGEYVRLTRADADSADPLYVSVGPGKKRWVAEVNEIEISRGFHVVLRVSLKNRLISREKS